MSKFSYAPLTDAIYSRWHQFGAINVPERRQRRNYKLLRVVSGATSDCPVHSISRGVLRRYSVWQMNFPLMVYLQGTWVWLADHDLDGDGSTQVQIYSGRGILSESAGPVWLIGTGERHLMMIIMFYLIFFMVLTSLYVSVEAMSKNCGSSNALIFSGTSRSISI